MAAGILGQAPSWWPPPGVLGRVNPYLMPGAMPGYGGQVMAMDVPSPEMVPMQPRMMATDMATERITPSSILPSPELGPFDPPFEPHTGSIFPVSIDAYGNRYFDSNAGVLGGIKRSLNLLPDVMSGRLPLPQPGSRDIAATDAAIERIFEAASLAATGGAATAGLRPPGLGIFGGRLAKTADLEALKRAEQMAELGAPRETIWQETGWFQGVDGKWRFEIADDKSLGDFRAAIDEDGLGLGAQVPLGGVLDHKDLFLAYPDMSDLDVRVMRESDPFGYSQRGGKFGEFMSAPINATDDAARSNLLHETQHAIQRREQFPVGGNPAAFAPNIQRAKAKAVMMHRVLAIRDIAKKEKVSIDEAAARYQRSIADPITGATEPLDADVLMMARSTTPNAEFRKWLKEYEGTGRQSATDIYRRQAGEVEARNVQTRMDMTPDQRRATPPWETQDIPDIDQIIRWSAEGPQMSLPEVPPALPMDYASRMARAKEMGFPGLEQEHWLYRGQPGADQTEFSPDYIGGQNRSVGAAWFTDDPLIADEYIPQTGMSWEKYPENAGIIPAVVRGKTIDITADNISKEGYDALRAAFNEMKDDWELDDFDEFVDHVTGGRVWEGGPGGRGTSLRFQNQVLGHLADQGYDVVRLSDNTFGKPNTSVVVFDPKNIRSPSAAFDPAQSHSPNILASGGKGAVIPGLGIIGMTPEELAKALAAQEGLEGELY